MLGIDFSGYHALWVKYLTAFRQSWASRSDFDLNKRLPEEAAFLPAELEIVETPPHPAPRWTARILVVIGLCTFAVLVLGHLDIVATAPGKLVPNARVKVIQPAVTGVVRNIYVHDGELVKSGQVLIELDPSQAAADTGKATANRLDAALTVARSLALIRAQSEGHMPKVDHVAAAPADRQSQAQDFAEGLYKEYVAKRTSMEAELQKRKAELATVKAQIQKLSLTAPLAQQQAEDYKKLATGHYVSSHDYLDKEQNAISQREEMAAQISHSHELEAAIVEQQSDIQNLMAAFKREQLDSLGKAQAVLSQASNDQTKAEVRQSLMRLTAPVSGTVQQLSVHTVGGVVTTAQPILEIVPDDALEVEARLENKDIGFVAVGQPVVVKIDAFPYTRFGYLTGTVESVSNDAATDKRGGLYFSVRVKIPSRQLHVGDKAINLTPGMEVKAEIRTGRRSVAEYFLSPLLVTTEESLRER